MSKQTRWLFSEIERWTADKLIAPEQAVRIRALYREPVPAISWGLVVFSGIGVVIVGLGVILLFAYNWDGIPKFGKLALILGALLGAHVGALKLRDRDGWPGRLAEVLALLGTMMFGAGIWLVAQIYHINEHFPTGFLVWALGALAMAWVWPSVAHGLLAVVLIAIWSGSEVFEYRIPVDWSLLLLALGVAPLAWRLRSAVLAAGVLAALYAVLLFHAGLRGGGTAVFSAALAASVLLLGLRRVLSEEALLTPLRRVVGFFGTVGFLFCTYLLTFEAVVRGLIRGNGRDEFGSVALGFVYQWAVAAAALGIWIYLLWRVFKGARDLVRTEEWLGPIALIFAHVLLLLAERGDAAFYAGVFNLVVLGVATTWMMRGCRNGRLAQTVLGSLLLAVLVFARYFDLFDNLAVRGLVFLVLGGVLFAEGFYYRRLRREDVPGKEAS